MHGRHGYETDTLGALGIFVVEYLGARYFAVLAEKMFQLGAIHRERQITHHHSETRLVMFRDVNNAC